MRPTTAPRAAPPVLYGGFFVCGAVAALLGPMVPELGARFGLSQAELGTLFVPLFGASSLGALLSTFAPRRSLVLGYGLAAAGLALAPVAPWPAVRLVLLPVGLGIGLAVPSTNLLVARGHPGRRGAALSRLNFMWGLGAVACPLLFAAVRAWVGMDAVVWGIGAAAAAVSVWSLRSLRPASTDLEADPDAATRRASVRYPFADLGLLAAMLFFYIGVETTLGGWLVELAEQRGAGGSSAALVTGAAFWAALLAGRAAAPTVLQRITEPTLHWTSIVLSFAGVAVLWASGTGVGVVLGTVVAGLGLAALFPLTVSLLSARTEASGARHVGWVFAFGGLGGATAPWLTGRIADAAGSLQAGFAVPLLALLVLAALRLLYALRPSARGA